MNIIKTISDKVFSTFGISKKILETEEQKSIIKDTIIQEEQLDLSCQEIIFIKTIEDLEKILMIKKEEEVIEKSQI